MFLFLLKFISYLFLYNSAIEPVSVNHLITQNSEKTSMNIQPPPVSSLSELYEVIDKCLGKRIFLLFWGTPGTDGQSWCPDCRKADPIFDEALKQFPAAHVFLRVYVGDRSSWKNQHNPFRLDEKLKVSSIPTLIEFNTDKRLSDPEIYDVNEILKMFEEN